ncbi:MAG: hypothetical protein KDC98_00005, partial [Planctomycetes bacterium]|nr:hypothetical protein [Planctomycetota bacterium]
LEPGSTGEIVLRAAADAVAGREVELTVEHGGRRSVLRLPVADRRGLLVSHPVLDLGAVDAGQRHSFEFGVRGVAAEGLQVCGEGPVEDLKLTRVPSFEPGRRWVVRGFLRNDASFEDGAMSTRVSVIANGCENSVTVRWRTRPADLVAAGEPPGIFFGYVPVGTEHEQSVALDLVAGVTVEIETIGLLAEQADFVEVSVEQTPTGPRLVSRLDRSAPEGIYSAKIHLRAANRDPRTVPLSAVCGQP